MPVPKNVSVESNSLTPEETWPMTAKRYVVDLSEEERQELESFVSSGTRSAQAITRARILLKADHGDTDEKISEVLDCSTSTVYRMRKRYANDGIESIHRRPPDRDYEQKLDGEAEARLIALACGDPPEGRTRWTLRLLADEFVALKAVEIDSVSHETVRQTLKKTNSSLTARNSG